MYLFFFVFTQKISTFVFDNGAMELISQAKAIEQKHIKYISL